VGGGDDGSARGNGVSGVCAGGGGDHVGAETWAVAAAAVVAYGREVWATSPGCRYGGMRHAGSMH
jgi:hypothetical protein